MGYDHKRLQNRLRAGALLRELRSRTGDFGGSEMTDMSLEAQAGSPYWRLSNVTGVHVYSTGEGWMADVSFKGVPAGIGDVLGTAVPSSSRREAIECAIPLLAACAEREHMPLPDPGYEILYFGFDDCGIPVEGGMVRSYVDRVREKGDTPETIRASLAELRYMITGNEPLHAVHFHVCPDELKIELFRACTSAMALGMTRFDMDDAVHAPGPRI